MQEDLREEDPERGEGCRNGKGKAIDTGGKAIEVDRQVRRFEFGTVPGEITRRRADRGQRIRKDRGSSRLPAAPARMVDRRRGQEETWHLRQGLNHAEARLDYQGLGAD